MRWALVASFGAACTAPSASQPDITTIDPPTALNVDPTSVSIIGTELAFPVTSNIDTGRTSTGALAATIGDVPLEGVQWIDATHIDAIVPAGLTPGFYDITVALGDARAMLAGGFEVTALGAFGPPAPVTALASMALDDDPTLTADGLELFFNSDRGGNSDLWVTTRASLTDAWGAPVPVAELNSTSSETTPGITADGLTIYFGSNRAGAGNTDIYVATRAMRGGTWSTPAIVGELSTSTFSEHGVQPSATGLSIVFNSDRSGTTQLYKATRAGASDPWSSPVALSELASGDEADPTLAAQDLVVVFHSAMRGGNLTATDLYMARRAATQVPFDPPKALAELNTPQGDSDGWISEDLRYILFTSDRSGVSQIYEARR